MPYPAPLAGCLLALLAASSAAGPRMLVPQLPAAPRIDGRLASNEWRMAAATVSFCRTGGPGRATVYVARHGTNLCVAFQGALGRGSGPAGPRRTHDDAGIAAGPHAWCVFGNGTTGISLISLFGCDGAVFDAARGPGRATGTPAWDGAWQVAVGRTNGVWTLEATAPLAAFGPLPDPDANEWQADFGFGPAEEPGRSRSGFRGDPPTAGGSMAFRERVPAFQLTGVAFPRERRVRVEAEVTADGAEADLVVTARFGASRIFAEQDVVVSRQVSLSAGESRRIVLEADLPMSSSGAPTYAEITGRATEAGVLHRQVLALPAPPCNPPPRDAAAAAGGVPCHPSAGKQLDDDPAAEAAHPTWMPLQGRRNAVKLWNRHYLLDAAGLASELEMGGSSWLTGPMRLVADVGGRPRTVPGGKARLRHAATGRLDLDGRIDADGILLETHCRVEADGFVLNRMRLHTTSRDLRRLTLEVCLPRRHGRFLLASSGGPFTACGETPAAWSSASQAPSALPHPFVPYLLLTDGEHGLACFTDSTAGWLLERGTPVQEVVSDGDNLLLRIHFVQRAGGPVTQDVTFVHGWMATPARPQPAGWRAFGGRENRHPMARPLPSFLGRNHMGVAGDFGIWGPDAEPMANAAACSVWSHADGYHYLALRDLVRRVRMRAEAVAGRGALLWQRPASLAPHVWLGDVHIADGGTPPLGRGADVMDAFPVARLTALASGRAVGAASLMPEELAFEAGSPERQIDRSLLTEQFLGWTLMHDIVPATVPCYSRVLMPELEMWDPNVRFIPHERLDARLACSTPGVRTSVHLWPGRQVVLWVANTNASGVRAGVNLDLPGLGLPTPQWALDVMSGAAITADARPLVIEVPPRGWRAVRFVRHPLLAAGCSLRATYEDSDAADASLGDRWPLRHATPPALAAEGRSGRGLLLGDETAYSGRTVLADRGTISFDAQLGPACRGALLALKLPGSDQPELAVVAEPGRVGLVVGPDAAGLHGWALLPGRTPGGWHTLQLAWDGPRASLRVDGQETVAGAMPAALLDSWKAPLAPDGRVPALAVGPAPGAVLDNLRVERLAR